MNMSIIDHTVFDYVAYIVGINIDTCTTTQSYAEHVWHTEVGPHITTNLGVE